MAKFTAPKRFTAKNIPTISIENIRDMGEADLIRLANAYQREFRRRERSFKGHYSYAADVLRQSMKNRKGTTRKLGADGHFHEEAYEVKPFYKTFSKINKKRVKARTEKVGVKQSMNDLKRYNYQMARFFNDSYAVGAIRTNTLEGILATENRLSGQLFGFGDNGLARVSLDTDTLRYLYRTYNEFIHSVIGEGMYDSNDVMAAVGMLYETGNLSLGPDGVNADDLRKLSLLYSAHREHHIDLYEPAYYTPEDEYVEAAADLVHKVFHEIEPGSTISLSDDIMLEVTGPFGHSDREDDVYPL